MKPGPPKNILKVVQGLNESGILRDARASHDPEDRRRGHYVKSSGKPTEKRDVRASDAGAKETQLANYGCCEDAKCNCCAEMKKGAEKNCRRTPLEERYDSAGRLPRPRKIRRTAKCSDKIEAS